MISLVVWLLLAAVALLGAFHSLDILGRLALWLSRECRTHVVQLARLLAAVHDELGAWRGLMRNPTEDPKDAGAAPGAEERQ